jgi:hypothetical protein
MNIELNDLYKASQFQVKFLSYKTPNSTFNLSNIPKKFCFQFRFFTFPEIKTDNLALLYDSYD